MQSAFVRRTGKRLRRISDEVHRLSVLPEQSAKLPDRDYRILEKTHGLFAAHVERRRIDVAPSRIRDRNAYSVSPRRGIRCRFKRGYPDTRDPARLAQSFCA